MARVGLENTFCKVKIHFKSKITAKKGKQNTYRGNKSLNFKKLPMISVTDILLFTALGLWLNI